MISSKVLTNTRNTLSELYARQGGGLFFNTVVDNTLDKDMVNWKVAAKVPSDYKEFSISIYNTKSNLDITKLTLFINPKDLSIGQQQLVSGAYSRKGWVNSAWGNQQATLTASGISSGFYFYTGNRGGLTNLYRRRSPSFINLIDLMGLFKNNGWYFLDGASNPTMFKDGTSRVINVMDSIKIEYDGSTYIGSFSTFTLNDDAASPYRMEYSFEFIVSSFGTDLQDIEGHISMNDNYKDGAVHLALQGFNIGFEQTVGLDADELKNYFPAPMSPRAYEYTVMEHREEEDFFSKQEEASVSNIAEGTFRITRGWRDKESHGFKADFRTSTSTVYSATKGIVNYVTAPNFAYGGCNYIIVTSEWEGVPIYVRYFHLDPSSISLVKGNPVEIGSIIGKEGTDNGKYPQHCDFGVRIIGSNPNYLDCAETQCSPILDNMWNVLHKDAERAGSPFKKDFMVLVAKHPSESPIPFPLPKVGR